MGRRKQTFTVINPLVGHDDKPQPQDVAYDGKQTAASMLSNYDGAIKCKPYTTDAGV